MRHSILVVGDHFFPIDATRTQLSMLGMGVIGPALSLPHAVGLLEEKRPSAVLLDIDRAESFVFDLADLLAGQGVPFGFIGAASALCTTPERHLHRPALRKPFGVNHIDGFLQRLGCVEAQGVPA